MDIMERKSVFLIICKLWLWYVCAIRFRSDPDHWARYFRVQRMIAQLDRVEREAAEKRQQEKETVDEPQPLARVASAKKSPPRGAHRPISASSALKIFVFGSESRQTSETDPSPLLAASRGTESSLKPSRSAEGRLDACCGALPTDSPPTTYGEGLSRTHSCDVSGGKSAGTLKLTRSPESTTILQVSNVWLCYIDRT